MYVENLMTLFIEATEELFDADFPYEDMRGISVHTEYPLDVASYPGLWVQFVPQSEVRNVGIGHVEYKQIGSGPNVKPVYRWRFAGVVEITAAALSSLERARMIDWIVKAIGFGRADNPTSLGNFRRKIENNDLIPVTAVWEAFSVGGFGETPGTPWGTDDVIYEGTVTLTIEGEYVFDPQEAVLVPLSALVIEDPSISPAAPNDPDQGWR